MNTLLDTAVMAIALLAAIRSTWSPCGRSMLSSITPIGEAGRGARYATSAAWFVAGATAGGACLGGALAGVTALVALAPGRSGTVVAVVVATAAAVTALSDVGVVPLPVHHRQVNERWLDRFRPWVYAGGFGWQIGTGFATYVTTAGLYLLVALCAVSGRPALGLAAGTVFGACRGLAVLLGRSLTDPGALSRFHRRFDDLERWPRTGFIGAQVVVSAAATSWLWPPAGPAVLVAAVVGARAVRGQRRTRGAATPKTRPRVAAPVTPRP